jgi:hypothetical protein
VLIDKYAQKTALRLGVTPDAVRTEFKKLGRSQKSSATASESQEPAAAAIAPVPMLERWLLRIMLTNDDLVPWIAERLQPGWLRHPGVKQIAEARIEAFRNDTWNGVAPFLAQQADETLKQLVTHVVSDKNTLTNPEQTLKGDPIHGDKRGTLERLRDDFLEAEMTSVQQRINHPDLADEDRMALLHRQQELRLLKRQPLLTHCH